MRPKPPKHLERQRPCQNQEVALQPPRREHTLAGLVMTAPSPRTAQPHVLPASTAHGGSRCDAVCDGGATVGHPRASATTPCSDAVCSQHSCLSALQAAAENQAQSRFPQGASEPAADGSPEGSLRRANGFSERPGLSCVTTSASGRVPVVCQSCFHQCRSLLSTGRTVRVPPSNGAKWSLDSLTRRAWGLALSLRWPNPILPAQWEEPPTPSLVTQQTGASRRCVLSHTAPAALSPIPTDKQTHPPGPFRTPTRTETTSLLFPPLPFYFYKQRST